MNPSRILGHAAGSAAASTVWLTAISMPAGPADPWLIAAGLIGPAAVATTSLLLQHAAGDPDRRDERHTGSAEPVPMRPSPRPRPALTAAQPVRRKELTR